MTTANEVMLKLNSLSTELTILDHFEEELVQYVSDNYEVASFEQMAQAIATVRTFLSAYAEVEEEADAQG